MKRRRIVTDWRRPAWRLMVYAWHLLQHLEHWVHARLSLSLAKREYRQSQQPMTDLCCQLGVSSRLTYEASAESPIFYSSPLLVPYMAVYMQHPLHRGWLVPICSLCSDRNNDKLCTDDCPNVMTFEFHVLNVNDAFRGLLVSHGPLHSSTWQAHQLCFYGVTQLLLTWSFQLFTSLLLLSLPASPTDR